MLILSRKRREAVIFTAAEAIPAGTEIRVLITDVGQRYVHLGIEAPRSIDITREELVGQPRKEKPCPKPSE